MKVLVADDETIERKVLCKTLKNHLGDLCEIYEARTGREAVEIFVKEGISIALLDIDMPGQNGLEAARQMRAADENCVIVFITAFDEFSYAKQAISVRALDYILKPYDSEEVIAVVEEGMRIVKKQETIQKNLPQEETEKGAKVQQEPLPEEKLMEKERALENARISALRELVEQYIREHYAEDISMYDLAQMMNYSEAYFCKLFKQCFKVNFTAYLLEYRLKIAEKLLADPKANIKMIGQSCGYADSNYFTRVFKRAKGMTPSEFRLSVFQKKG